jgi:hypothetical protein
MFLTIKSQSIFALVLAAGMAGSVAKGDLIHRYSFTDGVKDSVGKLDGKLVGDSAKVDAGKLTLKNEATTPPEKVSHVEFPGALIPKGSKAASLAIWFTAKDTQPFSRLIDIGDIENAEGRSFIYISPRTADDQARAAITSTDVSGRIPLDNTRLDDDKPHCLIITFDDMAKKMHVFIDGKEPAPAEDITDAPLSTVNPVVNRLGKSLFDVDPGLSATIDEFRVYDKALSAEDVAAIQKAGPDALPPAAPATQPARN